jgi:cobalt-zinc-cadmium efflux system membrane fusion protein
MGSTAIPLVEVRRAPRLDEASRTLTVDLKAAEPLYPGLSGKVSLLAEVEGLSVPAEALTRLEGREVVFGKSAKGVAPVGVERLGRDGDRVVIQVLGDAPEEVATRGLFLLKSQFLLESGEGP